MIADVSVVVPCYNASGTIERALLSVMRQTMLPRELIIVDDCSSDSSFEQIQEFAQSKRQDIHCIVHRSSVNFGAAKSRNIGWELATSRYVAFLDADDTWMPHKLERQYAWMASHPECVLSGHKCLYPHELALDREYFFKKISALRLLISNPFPTPSVMVRRDIPQRFDFSQHCLEDHLLWAEIILSGEMCCYSNQMLAQVYKNAYGASGLSKNLIDMECGELSMYHKLYRKELLSHFQAVLLMGLSLMKFLRRLAVHAFRYASDKVTV